MESGLRELFESDSDGYIVNQKYHYENPFDPMCEILHKTTIHLLEKEDDKVYRVLIDVYPNGHQHIYYRTLCEYVVDKTININVRNYVFINFILNTIILYIVEFKIKHYIFINLYYLISY